MPTDTPIPASLAAPQAQLPSQQDASCAAVLSSPSLPGERQPAPTPLETCLHNRVQRVLQDIAAARSVSDDEIRQHIEDCRFLMEAAHDRFLATDDDAHRQEAYGWLRLRDEALHMLSPEFKRARDLQVLRAAAAEPGGTGCYFLDQADRARRERQGR